LKFSPRTWHLLGILYICYIIYGTLLPFNFSFSFEFIQNNLGNIEWIEQYGQSYFITKNIDAIANIFFFIPLGIIIYNARYALGHKRKYIFDIALATLSGLLLSLIIELLQLLIEERKTSLIDILMNTLGCFSGAILGYIINQILAKSARQKIEVFIRNIPTVILLIPFLLMSFFIPEKFSFNFLKSEKIENIYFNWDYIFRPIWIWLILYVHIPIGMLISRFIRNRYSRFPPLVIYLTSIFVAVTIISIIELIKYISHTTSVPQVNIFFGIFGLLIGIAFSEVLLIDRYTLNKTGNRQIVIILSGIYIFLGFIILYKSAYPFDFNLSRSYLFDKTLFSLLSMYSFIPFSGFQKLFIYSAQNILLFIPVGIILCELELYLSKKGKIFLLVMSSILFILIPFAIQILNQNLTPFLYEIPTNVFGIFTGYFIWYGFRRGAQPY
jgi:glycopeptide antibiotics resistance protein